MFELSARQRSLLESVFAKDAHFDDDTRETWGRDRTWQFPPRPCAVVFPRQVTQIQELVRIAREQRLKLTPSGGRTGLCGGATATNGEVLVSMDRMSDILDSDPTERQVLLQAGAVTAALQEHARSMGLFYPVDFASSGSSQIGGNIGTNAGGIRVLRYGGTRQWVSGLEVVTGEGQLLDLNKGLIKNNTGYDLRQLLIGSEGTLGIIVRARMLLTTPMREPQVMLLGVRSLPAAMEIFRLSDSRLQLTACEFFSDRALASVLEHSALRPPFAEKHSYNLLLEFETEGPATIETAAEVFESAQQQDWAQDGILAESLRQNAELWRLREDISESLARYTPFKSDIAVLPSRLPVLLETAEQIIKGADTALEPVWFGHIGDGNLHLNIPCPDGWELEPFQRLIHTLGKKLSRTLRSFGGSVSAEHGIGLLRKSFLKYSRSREEIAIMKGVKRTMDPDGIMNPGKIF